MVDANALKFNVTRVPVTKNSIDYVLHFSDGRLGKAGIVLFPTHFFDYSNIYEHLLEKGLKPDSTLTFINSFYPNGEFAKEECMRKGAGSAFLELIIKDSADWGSEVLYCSTASKSMASFLQKKGFTWYADERYYNLLTNCICLLK